MVIGKSPHKMLRQATWLLLAAGVCLHLTTALLLGSGGASFRAGLYAWSLAPYLLFALVLRRNAHGAGMFLGVLLALLIDANAFWSVFVAPKNSTAALDLLTAPFLNLVYVTPLAIIIETYVSRKR